jgi:hypothetical protein
MFGVRHAAGTRAELASGIDQSTTRIYSIHRTAAMATTTIHLPADLLRALDAVAARRKASRSRLLAEACRRLVDEDRGAWPADFFEMNHLSAHDRQELSRAGREMDKGIRGARRSRRAPPFRNAGS